MGCLRRALAPVRNLFTDQGRSPAPSSTIRATRFPRSTGSLGKRRSTPQCANASTRRPIAQPANPSKFLKSLLDRRARLRKDDVWDIEELKRILKKRQDEFQTIESEFERSYHFTDASIKLLLKRDGLWKETQEDIRKESEALRKANLKYLDDIRDQDADELSYLKAMKDGLSKRQDHPHYNRLGKCEPTLRFLASCRGADSQIKEGKVLLLNLQELLHLTKREEARALKNAGLEYYETDLKNIKQQIQEVEDHIVKIRRLQIADLGAFYTAAGLDLMKLETDNKTRPHFGVPRPRGTDEEIRSAQDDYHLRFNEMKRSREQFDAYRETYTDDLRTALETAMIDAPDKSHSQVEQEFTAQWLRKWKDMGSDLDEKEREFVGRQKQALGIGCEPVEINRKRERIVGSDIPQYFGGDHPEDGQVGSECSESKRGRAERASRCEPVVRIWCEKVEQIDEANSTPPAIESIHTSESGSIVPWDNVSLACRYPRRREMIDRYQIEMDEVRYHRGQV